MKSKPSSSRRQPRRRFLQIRYPAYDLVTLCQERDGETHGVTVSVLMLPLLIGGLVAVMWDTGGARQLGRTLVLGGIEVRVEGIPHETLHQ